MISLFNFKICHSDCNKKYRVTPLTLKDTLRLHIERTYGRMNYTTPGVEHLCSQPNSKHLDWALYGCTGCGLDPYVCFGGRAGFRSQFIRESIDNMRAMSYTGQEQTLRQY